MEPTRRQLVQMLAALGLGAAAAETLAAQRQPMSAGDLKGALAIQGRDMTDDEVAVVHRALQRSLDDFRRVREFEFPDDVALPTVFSPRRS